MARVNGFELPGEYYYDRKDHIWVRIEGSHVRIGLDMLAQKSAGDIKHLRFKPAGTEVAKKRVFGSIEAGKYVGPLRAPVGGKTLEINQKALDTPRIVNEDPYGEGWFIVLDPSNIEGDLADLVHGEEGVLDWLESEIAYYSEQGLLKDEEED